MTEKNQTAGRKANAAQPLGERHGLVSEKQTERTGETEKRSAGPDGPDAGKGAKSGR
jgi:hypothetical protein